MSRLYKMDDHQNPVPVDDMIEWVLWFGSANRTIARDEIGGLLIDTSFLGFGHCNNDLSRHDAPSYGEIDDEYLYETMVFGSDRDLKELDELARVCSLDTTSIIGKLIGTTDFQKRYTTVEQARRGHQAAKLLVERMLEWRKYNPVPAGEGN